MTKRLQEAIKLAESLPPEKQDQIADVLLDQIRGGGSRGREFERARKSALARLAEGFNLGGAPLSREETQWRLPSMRLQT